MRISPVASLSGAAVRTFDGVIHGEKSDVQRAAAQGAVKKSLDHERTGTAATLLRAAQDHNAEAVASEG